MPSLPTRRRLLTVLLVMAVVTAALWAVVLLGVVHGTAESMVRSLAWVMLVLTGGTAIGLRDANRAMDRGMRTPERPRRQEPPSTPEVDDAP